jgi:hypothetical protein
MKAINFESKYYEELLAFSKKMWPQKSEDYLKYRLFQFPEQVEDNKSNLLVINDEGKIIGCTLYLPTKARINGTEEKIYWGHDMIVEEKYRGAAGLLLIIEMCNNKSAFGFGATDINFKIQKELGTKFIGMANQYVVFNFWSLKLPLYKLKLVGTNKSHKFSFPDKLKAGQSIFEKISDVKEVNIPDSGYWGDNSISIDFVRDEHFLKNRFFENFLKYSFYRLQTEDQSGPDECYFVVRPSIEGGYLVLSIVDLRFNLKKPGQFKLILKAASSLGRSNRFPLVTLRTSFEFKKFNLSPLVYRTGSQEHIVTDFPVDDNPVLFVTNADADIDFLSDRVVYEEI